MHWQIAPIYKVIRERYGEDEIDRLVYLWDRGGVPYYFVAYPGAIELLQWVHSQNVAIDFFSSATVERNEWFCREMMRTAFGETVPSYRIFSAGHLKKLETPEDEAFYLGCYAGKYKKRLQGVVVEEADLPDCLLIDNENNYAAKGEEGHLVHAGFHGTEFKTYFARKEENEPYGAMLEGLELHHCFYLAGVLDQILKRADEKQISLRDAAVEVQYLDEDIAFPPVMDASGHQPTAHYKDAKYYLSGLKLLQRFKPELGFWYGIEPTWWDEQGICVDRVSNKPAT